MYRVRPTVVFSELSISDGTLIKFATEELMILANVMGLKEQLLAATAF